MRCVVGLLVVLSLLLSGCANLAYYSKTFAGQHRFYSARMPIKKALQRADLTDAQRHRLTQVPAILAFAGGELQLPLQGQYRDYVQLEQPYVLWSVFAAPALSLTPYRWCYLFGALCAEYRGYFREEDAQAEAAALAAKGYDTHVAGVSAFSTLGWRNDPVTSVLLAYPDDMMAMVLFHELAHAVLYIKDDTVFNESFASAVAEEGLRRWLLRRGESPNSAVLQRVRAQHEVLVTTALEARRALAVLYASALADEQKHLRKREILRSAQHDYERRCAALPVAAGLCASNDWFGDGLNNARLNAVAAYEYWVPAFATLLQAHAGDMAAFYRTVAEIGAMPRVQREALLRALLPPDSGERD